MMSHRSKRWQRRKGKLKQPRDHSGDLPERMANPDYQRGLMCHVVLIASVVVCVVFVPLNYWVYGNFFLVVGQLVYAVAGIGMIVHLNRVGNVSTTAPLATLMLALLFLLLVWDAPVTPPGMALTALFSGVAFYLLGLRRGLLAVMIFYPLALLAFTLNPEYAGMAPWRVEDVINTALLIVLFCVLCYAYEAGRYHVHQENTRIMERLHRQATRDVLTDLLNRRATEEALRREFKRIERHGGKLAFAIVDVDYFKNINDTYGHAGGDEVLIELAQIFEESIRASDMAGRWGGEEFALILPETDASAAVALIERLRARIERHRFINGARITISAGISEARPDDGVSSIALRADKAMYCAKKQGRNRLCTERDVAQDTGSALCHDGPDDAG